MPLSSVEIFAKLFYLNGYNGIGTNKRIIENGNCAELRNMATNYIEFNLL